MAHHNSADQEINPDSTQTTPTTTPTPTTTTTPTQEPTQDTAAAATDNSILPPSADIIPLQPPPTTTTKNTTTPNPTTTTTTTTPTPDPPQDQKQEQPPKITTNNLNTNNQSTNNQPNNQPNNDSITKSTTDQPKPSTNDQQHPQQQANSTPITTPIIPTSNLNTTTPSTAKINTLPILSSNSTNSAPLTSSLQQTDLSSNLDSSTPSQTTSRQSAHRPQQNSRNDDNNKTASSVGTIMGILVAAIIGAVILSGVLAMIKRRKKAKDTSDYHPDLFNEKQMGFHHDPERSSLDSGSGGSPTCPTANRSIKRRAEAAYGPRPPSIIERHQASPAVPGPMPSYQPGQIYNYPSNNNHPAPPHFNLHRPKPPTYDPYGSQPSELAYAHGPSVDPAHNPEAAQLNRNLTTRTLSHDQPQMSLPEQQGGMTMGIPSPIPYPPGAQGEPQPNYQHAQPNVATMNTMASYNQQQVDQLDFFGHPSPATTMVGNGTTEWSGSGAGEKAEAYEGVRGEAVKEATGIAVTEDGRGRMEGPGYADCYEGAAPLQQSFLDCYGRGSLDTPARPDRDPAEAIEMDDLRPPPLAPWQLASPLLASPITSFFDDHPRADLLNHPTQLDFDHRPKQPLQVVNY